MSQLTVVSCVPLQYVLLALCVGVVAYLLSQYSTSYSRIPNAT